MLTLQEIHRAARGVGDIVLCTPTVQSGALTPPGFAATASAMINAICTVPAGSTSAPEPRR